MKRETNRGKEGWIRIVLCVCVHCVKPHPDLFVQFRT